MNARETLVLVLNACTLQFGDFRTQFMLYIYIKLERVVLLIMREALDKFLFSLVEKRKKFRFESYPYLFLNFKTTRN